MNSMLLNKTGHCTCSELGVVEGINEDLIIQYVALGLL